MSFSSISAATLLPVCERAGFSADEPNGRKWLSIRGRVHFVNVTNRDVDSERESRVDLAFVAGIHDISEEIRAPVNERSALIFFIPCGNADNRLDRCSRRWNMPRGILRNANAFEKRGPGYAIRTRRDACQGNLHLFRVDQTLRRVYK